jgi:hypothetical protein
MHLQVTAESNYYFIQGLIANISASLKTAGIVISENLELSRAISR